MYSSFYDEQIVFTIRQKKNLYGIDELK